MFNLASKKFRLFFTLLLSTSVSASLALCHCPTTSVSNHHQSTSCHENQSGHHHEENEHQSQGHACLCDDGPISGYLTEAEKAPVKADFLFAVLVSSSETALISQPNFKQVRLTHSPPGEIRPLYITQSSLLI
ncbi:hypothetical protein K1X76_10790 [bacterium]|nr:hypothetical protein [bacterium]